MFAAILFLFFAGDKQQEFDTFNSQKIEINKKKQVSFQHLLSSTLQTNEQNIYRIDAHCSNKSSPKELELYLK